MSGHEGASPEALRRAGLYVPAEVDPRLAEHWAAQVAERAERGRPFNLTADEVAAADEGDMPLARYAAMKDVSNIEDFKRLERSGNDAA